MKVLLINGSPHPAGCTYTALHEVEKTLQKHGIGTEIVQIGTKPVAGCIACGICVKNCPMGAIRLEDNHPVIDESLCVSCGMCASKCPRGVIKDAFGILGPQL